MNTPEQPRPNPESYHREGYHKESYHVNRGNYGGYGGASHYYGSGYYGGYSAGNPMGAPGGEEPQTRTLQDYLVMIRERAWYLVLTVLVCTISSVIYTFNQTPEYMAGAKLRVTRRAYDLTTSTNVPDLTQVQNSEDFMTQTALMQSLTVVEKVDKRLSQSLRKEVLEPYQEGNIFTGPLRPTDVIMKCFDVKPVKGSLLVSITYRHPNPRIATELAQMFAEEIVNNNRDERAKIVNPAIEQMGLQLANKDSTIKELYKSRADMMDAYPGLISFGSKLSTANAELSSATATRDIDQKLFQDAKALWDRLQELKKEGLPITSLAAVSGNDRVMAMQSEVSKQEISVQGLKELYQDDHPRLQPAISQLAKAKSELAKAVAAAEAKIEQNYISAKTNFESSKARWTETNDRMMALNEASDKLELLNKKIDAEEKLRATLQFNYETEKLRAADNATNIQLADPAMLTSLRPINKNWFISSGIGIFGGIALGCGIIFLLAYLDDRVKSAADIESFLGLSLIGILPVAARMNSFRKARVVATGENRAVVEGFRSIYSALKINEVARVAKTILITSTTPSEGKSFVTTNLAITYAMHGEKVLVIDADLRMPAIGKTLQLEDEKGITRYFNGGVSLDDSIHHEIVPNLDVLQVGAPCKNPTQVINSRRFSEMILELREKYDRIFIDSPPVGAVSDSLNLLPQADGLLYVVRFNTVKRRFIKSNIRRLQESKVPIFGAVLNQIGLRVARYYTNTNDRSYSSYYGGAKDSVEVNVD